MKTALIVIAALAVGLGGGWALFHRTATSGVGAKRDPGVYYTCSMHPWVHKDHPGDCPVCQMTLTPVKIASRGEDEGAKGKKEHKIAYWRAPMDASYVSDKPGKSPMGMDLVPVYEDEISSGPTVRIDPVTRQNMGIRTAPVIEGPLVHEVRTVGNVTYDETKIGVVTLKVGGYIEKLLVDETGEHVKKGQPLFTMYAPEVVQAQDEYLSTKANYENSTGENQARWKSLLDQSRQKLLRWDLSEDQIAALEKRGHSEKYMTWRSPFDGIVEHKNALEGAYFKPGQPLYRIAGIDTVWVYASIYERDFPWVKQGQPARMTLPYFPGETFEGKVDYIYPYLDPKTRDRKVRLVFPNPGLELVPEMYATVKIESKLSDHAILVPGEAVLDTGERQVAYVEKPEGKFDPRNVVIGVEGRGGYREVLKGLRPGEVVVTSGQFLIDSESKIEEANQKMLESHSSVGGASKQAPGEKEEGGENAPVAAKFTAPPGLIPVVGTVCPVLGGTPVPDVFADYEGYRIFFCCSGCPARFEADPQKYMEKLRRMGALPAKSGAAKESPAPEKPAGAIASTPLYTCPMHPEVKQDHPGNCPICHMKLVPEKVGGEKKDDGKDR